MIKTFKHKGLEKFFYDDTTKSIQAKHAEKIADILDLLDAADAIKVMKFPGSRLLRLHPKKENIWAVNVSGNWRITFNFISVDANMVDYVDYPLVKTNFSY